MDDEMRRSARKQADLCSVFANANRVLILWTLVESEKSVGEIADRLGLSMPSTSQHLRLMKGRGIVKTRRDGQAIFYRLANHHTPAGCQLLIDAHRRRLRTAEEV